MVFGAVMYVLSSLQGSFEALRAVNRVAHFTHFTVAHAHLGAYAFVTMVLFGAIYFMLPRVLHREWPWPRPDCGAFLACGHGDHGLFHLPDYRRLAAGHRHAGTRPNRLWIRWP